MAVTATAGDRIVVNSDKAGVPARQGEILDVIPHSDRPEFRVRWDDGHVTEIRPRGASYQIQAKVSATKR